ncbi:MAG: suppressor of fused domain protein [Planctomycetota bacterium]|nr:suppressor of fused domain protein [Labilithrix sp.]MCW8140682.1 suppressor of fused domain protein [Planctomycetota bacterium]
MTLLDFSKLPDVSELHAELESDEERTFAAHMKAREDAFEHIFGETHPPGQILSPDDAQLSVNWPGGGVYAFPPRGERNGWHYVTHGLAQPMDEEEAINAVDDDERFSGLGVELVIATPESVDWAPSLLIELVRYLLFDPEARLIVPGDRIPTSAIAQLAPGTSLTHIIATKSPEYGCELKLPAGRCLLVHLVGATASEIARAKAMGGREGTDVLVSTLRKLGPGLVTDASRSCTTTDARFDAAWRECGGS